MSDLLPINPEVKADLTKPVENITDMLKGTHKGLGKIYYALIEPWVTNRKAKADMIAAESAREIKLLEAQTAKDIHEINAGMKEYRYGRLLDIKVTSLPDYYSQVKILNGICDAKRLEAAMFDAAIEINKIPEDEISDEPLNQTFFNHWRAEAELIDDEDLRKWWAHLLVEETKKPNSISPRTLDVAKNLSKREAKTFEKIIRFSLFDVIIVGPDGHPIGGNYSDVLSLQDAGLIGQISNHYCDGKDFPGMGEKQILMPIQGQNYLLVASGKRISFPCHVLTVAGKELLSTLHFQNDLDGIKMAARGISMHNNFIVIKLINPVPGKPLVVNQTPVWTTDE